MTGPPPDDLVSRLRAGDENAWARLYDQLAGPISGYARSRGVLDVDDLVGDVFAAAAERIGDFDGDDQRLRSWLFTIAHHRLADDLRKRRRRATDAADPSSFEELRESRDVEVEAVARLDAAGALALLDLLTEDQRDVVVLRVLGELTIAETAAVLGRPAGAVKALQHRGLQRIQRHLSGKPYPGSVSDDDSHES